MQRPKSKILIATSIATSLTLALYGCQVAGHHEREHTNTAQAGEQIRAVTDIENYEVSSGDSDITIDLLDETRAVRGTVVLYRTKDGVRGTYSDINGGTARYFTQRTSTGDGGVAFTSRYIGDGHQLEITGKATAEGELAELVYSWKDKGETVADRIAVVTDAQPIGDERVASWMQESGLAAAKDQPFATLYGITVDPSFRNALSGLEEHDQNAGGVGSTTQGIHTSPLCSSALTIVLAGAALSCTACLAALAAAAWTFGALAPLAAYTCYVCAGTVGIALVDLVACLIAYGTRTTQQDCIDECKDWENCGVDSGEHSCWHQCDESKCDNYYGNTGAYCSGNTCYAPPSSGGGGGGGGGGGRLLLY